MKQLINRKLADINFVSCVLWLILVGVIIGITVLVFNLGSIFKVYTTFVKPSVMDTATVTLILSVILILVANLANPITYRRHKKMLNYIQSIDDNTSSNFKSLNERVMNTESVLKYYMVEKDINTSLQKIIFDSLSYTTSDKFITIINNVGAIFVKFAINSHSIGLDHYNIKQLSVNINKLFIDTTNIIVSNTDNHFINKVSSKLEAKLNEYQDKMLSIANDNKQNSKMDRFRAVSEIILQEYLSIIIVAQLETK